ncbi:MAG: lipoate--protein ligase family protein [Nitrospirae bacterium]|nr:lipoate--protein ligase family protein [Nitrospirota bacterium]
MALDEAIAAAVRKDNSPPTLRLYGWPLPSVSLGAFQSIVDIDAGYCAEHDIQVVRRPTGGRGILHGEEITYSFSAVNEGLFSQGLLESYRHLSSAFSLALQKMGLTVTMKDRRDKGRPIARSPLCFQSTSYGELTIKGKKLIGSAQKRWDNGFLQQGSMPFTIDCALLASVFKNVVPSPDFAGLKDMIHNFDCEEFKKYLVDAFETFFGISLLQARPSDQEVEEAHILCAEKYRNPVWTTGALRDTRLCNNGIWRRA